MCVCVRYMSKLYSGYTYELVFAYVLQAHYSFKYLPSVSTPH